MKVLPGKTTLNWSECKSYADILFHKSDEGIARIAINRPEKRNAFRPQTVDELIDAFDIVRNDETIGVVLFTGAGPDKKGIYSFCSGGDQSVRGKNGYKNDEGKQRLNVLELQRLIRSLPKVVIALVPGLGTTLKYFVRRGNKVFLEAANPNYEPIELNKENVVFQGKLLAVWRKV